MNNLDVTIKPLYAPSPMFPTIDVPRAWRVDINGKPGNEHDSWDKAIEDLEAVRAWNAEQVAQWHREHPRFATEPLADNSYAEHFAEVLHRDEARLRMARY